MTIAGHRLRDHLKFLKPLFVFVAAVGLTRILLGALGASSGLVNVVSVTGAAALAILIAVVRMHIRRFGSYYNVVLAAFLIVAWGQILIIAAIVFSVVTRTENVFTRPEYSIPGDDPNHVHHILGHLTFALGSGILFGVATGCLLMFLLRKLLPPQGVPGSRLRAGKDS